LVDLGLRQVIENVLPQIRQAIMHEAKTARSERGSCRRAHPRGFLDDEHLGALLGRRQRRADRRIAGPDHDDIPSLSFSHAASPLTLFLLERACVRSPCAAPIDQPAQSLLPNRLPDASPSILSIFARLKFSCDPVVD
jgi:hypothetical protein